MMLWTLPTSSCSTAGESSEPYQPTGLLGQFCYAAFTNLLHAFATPPFGRDGDMRDRRLPLGCELQRLAHTCNIATPPEYGKPGGADKLVFPSISVN